MSRLIYHSNCTLPATRVGYFASPPVRGTLDILWGCVGILILCTWSIQHLNLPVQRRPKTKRQIFRRKLSRFWKKAKWMLIALFAPEYIMGKAIADLWSAQAHKKSMQELADGDCVEWSVTHAFFANMGGFVIRFSENLISEIHQEPAHDHAQDMDDKEERIEHETNSEELGSEALNPVAERTDGADQDAVNTGELGIQKTSLRPSVPETASESGAVACQSATARSNSAPIVEQGRRVTFTRETNLDPIIPVVKRRSSAFEQAFQSAETHVQFRLNATDSEIKKIFADYKTNKRISGEGFIEANEEPWKVNNHNRKIIDSILEGVESRQVTDARFLTFYANAVVLIGDTWIVDAAQLHLARKMGIINRLPDVTEDDLDDKNKGDFLVNFAAVIQILWLFLQLGVRWRRNLPISQLEVVALAFAVCSLITFSLQWNKPQDCGSAIVVEASRYATRHELIKIANAGPDTIIGLAQSRNWMPNNAVHAIEPGVSALVRVAVGNVIGASIFGTLHCVAWDSPFPTRRERMLWHVACVVATVVPAVAVSLQWIVRKSLDQAYKRPNKEFDTRESARSKKKKGDDLRKFQHRCTVAGTAVFGFSYCVARLFLTVEVFRALCFLPPDVFITTWATGLPHFS